MPDHDDHRLRRSLAARRAGDQEEARRWWDELLTANHDRVITMVRIEARGRLSDDELADAINRALLKVSRNMFRTFRGTSVGEWILSVRKLVHGVCVDVQRAARAARRHQVSLDAALTASEHDADVYAAIEKRRRLEEQTEIDGHVYAAHSAFLDWAVPQLSPRLRSVVELDRQNLDTAEIQKRLDVTADVIYTSRNRAAKDLAKLWEQYTP